MAGGERPADLGWLSASEQARLHGLQRESRRQAFLAGRWLARCLVGAEAGVSPQALRLELDAQGRSLPVRGLHLSISHSGAWVAAAVGASAGFGIDLEWPRPGRDWAGIAALIGLRPCATADDFYRHWTLSEAWLKAQPEAWSLAELAPLRWVVDADGAGLHLQADGGPHLALYGAGRLRWWQPPPLAWRDGGRWSPQSTPKSK